MLPVPGPISNTVSVGFNPALATMAVTTAGFLRKCCPRDVLGATRLDAPSGLLLRDVDDDASLVLDDDEREYGAEEAAVGLERRTRLVLGMASLMKTTVWCRCSVVVSSREDEVVLLLFTGSR